MAEQPQPQGTIAFGETSIEINIPASLFLREQPRPDGYQPLMNAAWVWHQIIASTIIANDKLHPDTFRYLWNIARRLDAAHRQFEVVRAGIDRAAELESDRMACRRQIFQVLGDTELAVIALSRALQLVLEIPRRFPALRIQVPRIIKRRASAVLALRANCEHLEVDELQRPLIDKDQELIAVFRAPHLFEERRVVGAADSLGIDGEATGLLVHARAYLVEVITRLTRRVPDPPVAPAAGSETPPRRRRR
jgi:hypothetical protein